MSIIIADTGALISLIHTKQLDLIETIFGDFFIPNAVWKELNDYKNPDFDRVRLAELKSKIYNIQSKNHLDLIMDFGESEAILLYEEIQADYLLIDDKKARMIAESLGVNCIGTIGLLIRAKQAGLLSSLKPIFEKLLDSQRYFSKNFLNSILKEMDENPFTN